MNDNRSGQDIEQYSSRTNVSVTHGRNFLTSVEVQIEKVQGQML